MSDAQAPILIRAPPSKSVTHRAFILGAQAEGGCVVVGPLLGADCRSTLAVLAGLGAVFDETDDGDVVFEAATLRAAEAPLDCGNSGTTLRLMAGQVARLAGKSVLTGDESLRARPNGPLLDALAELGAAVSSDDSRAPLRIGGPLTAGNIEVSGGLSSQYISSLLLALAFTPGDSILRVTAPVASRPYLQVTRDAAAAFGITWDEQESAAGLRFEIPGGQHPQAKRYRVEGDWSGAAFPLVAGAIGQVPVSVAGLAPESPQGDRAVVEILKRFGAAPHWEGGQLVIEPTALNAAGEVDLAATPDLFPALCVLAACAPGQTRFVGAPSLRHKESDRIAVMARGLSTLGIAVRERPDGLDVTGGGALGGGVIASHGDHRIHMAFALLGLATTDTITIDDPECVAVSYPDFHRDLKRFRDHRPTP